MVALLGGQPGIDVVKVNPDGLVFVDQLCQQWRGFNIGIYHGCLQVYRVGQLWVMRCTACKAIAEGSAKPGSSGNAGETPCPMASASKSSVAFTSAARSGVINSRASSRNTSSHWPGSTPSIRRVPTRRTSLRPATLAEPGSTEVTCMGIPIHMSEPLRDETVIPLAAGVFGTRPLAFITFQRQHGTGQGGIFRQGFGSALGLRAPGGECLKTMGQCRTHGLPDDGAQTATIVFQLFRL